MCHIVETQNILANSIAKNHIETKKQSEDVSAEEWEFIKFSKADNRELIINLMMVKNIGI